jgi:LmbE family N-acetylglucosaminyl deacetylase
VLAVCAHPDDESFGLGAVICAFVDAGSRVNILCFTQGEASTLHDIDSEDDLARRRVRELEAAADCLGIGHTALLAYPDGALASAPLEDLARRTRDAATDVDADLLLVFDEGGITGHPDHCRATQAAVTAAEEAGLPVVAWVTPESVARELNEEFGTSFVGRPPREIDIAVPVDRTRQLEAVCRHESQLARNPVPHRRLELTGPIEYLRYLRNS